MSNHQRPYLWVEFEKTGKLRHLAHLEVARVFDRAVRRAGIPVEYTEGFHPRAKISFAPPLPVGAEGRKELCEIDLASEASVSPRELGKALSKQLPAGLNLVSAQVLARGRRSPFADLARVEYNVTVDTSGSSGEQLAAAVERFRQAAHVIIERQTKRQSRQVDIRPHTYELKLERKDGENRLYMSIGFGQQSLVKPEEIVSALAEMMGEGELEVSRLVRLGMYRV